MGMQKNYFSSVYFVFLILLCNSLFSAVKTSNGTGGGNYTTGASWTGGVAPASGDDIVIQTGDIVTINSNITVTNISISGTLRYGNNSTARTVTCSGTITINSGGTFDVTVSSNTNHILTYSGASLINNGTLNFSIDANSICRVTFNNNGNQTVSGTGATTNFNQITANLGTSISNVLEFSCSNFTSSLSGFLVLTNGTVKFSNSNSFTGDLYSGSGTIPATGKIWLNAPNTTLKVGTSLTVTGALQVDKGTLSTGTVSSSGKLTVSGTFTLTGGTINAGNGNNERLVSSNGTFNISGGILNVSGRFDPNNGSSTTNFTMSGGTMICADVSTTSTNAPFDISVSGSAFNMSGGTILINRSGGSNTGINITGVTSSSVTGGTFQIGDTDTPASNIMQINSIVPFYNLTVVNANSTAKLLTNSLVVKNNLTVTAGILLANNLNLNVGGNWSNSGTFTAGTGTVTFDGTSAQSITKSGGETFNHLVFSNAGTKTLGSNITANGNITINTGAPVDVSASNYSITTKGNFSNAGTFTARSGSVTLSGTSAQTIGGTSTTNFYTLVINNSAGVKLTSAQNVTNLLTVTNGTFNTQNNAFTLVSTSRTQSARIGFLASGTADVTGDVTVQRKIEAGPTGWHLLASPISGSSLSDWADDFTMTGFPGSAYPSFSFVSVYSYDETMLGTYDVGYAVPSDISDATGKGLGYWCYIGPTPVTIDVTGPINKFSVDAGVSFTDDPAQVTSTHDGWNLVFNPYPCTIDWEASSGYTKTKIDNSFQIWNETTQQYEGWNATTHTGINGRTSSLIPSSQGFYIQTTGTGAALIFNENAKVGASDGTFLKTGNPGISATNNSGQYPQFVLKITGNGYNDEAKLLFTSNATSNFDSNYDTPKFFSPTPGVPNIATRTANTNQDLGLNSLPPDSSLNINVNAHVTSTGTYTIDAEQFIAYPNSVCLILEDTYTHNFHNLRTMGDYSCTLYDTTLSARFILHIGKTLNLATQNPACIGYTNGSIAAQGLGTGPFNYVWKNNAGTVIRTVSGVSGADSLKNIAEGTYIVEVSGNTGSCANLSDTIVVSNPDSLSNNTSVTRVSCNGMNDGALQVNSTTGGNGPYTFVWSNNNTTSGINNLGSGTYTLSTTDANGCVRVDSYNLDITYPVTASFSFTDDTLYLSDGGEMTVNNTSIGGSTYTWEYGDGSLAETVPDAVHIYTSTGVYQVSLVVLNGPCSDTVVHQLVVIDTMATTGVHVQNNSANNVWLENNIQQPALNFNFEKETPVSIVIYNELGQVLNNEKVNATKRVLLNTSGLSNGIYFVQCLYNNTGRTFKLKVASPLSH